ncbi:MAG: HAMP domain-containing protein [Betaproteobacteria bacterium]|nr:MAG: HAMP domain-containing protein [Betaproteobacteria bacterium]
MTLFARSYLLIALLIVASVAGWFGILHTYQREPIALELSQQTISIVNLTRAALVNAESQRRLGLLRELSDLEGIRVFGASPEEKLEPVPPQPLLERVMQMVRGVLGERTRFAWSRDGLDGFWVSFFIDDDEFWIMLPRERVEPDPPWQWLGWGALTLALSLIAAWLIASRIAGPLAELARAAERVGRGETPAPLAEQGPRELRTVAAAFNRMTRDLALTERERAMVLAGISHDVRTPLSRLRLALELSGGERAVSDGMSADIDEIDQVIGQFLDFARGESEARVPADVDALIRDVAEHYARRGSAVALAAPPQAGVLPLAQLSVRRALMNLVDNALRYAGGPVEIAAWRSGDCAALEVLDRGPGVPPGEAERLKRPFTRLDKSRGALGGAGLGLAIVERVAQAHGGALQLLAREGGGLRARLTLALR